MKADDNGVMEHLLSHYPGAIFKCAYESYAWGFTLQRKLPQACWSYKFMNCAEVEAKKMFYCRILYC